MRLASTGIMLAWIAVVLSLGLMSIRLASAVSFSEPLLVATSGAEEESSFALWKYVHGEPVYASPFRIPFAATYYNWLFYAVYGETMRLVLAAWSLSDSWLPTVGRLISLTFAAIGTGLIVPLLRRTISRPLAYRVAAAWGIYLFWGPLMGFWALSLNPELPATVLAVAGSLAFLSKYPATPMRATLAASLCSYGAWAFKQSHFFLAATLFLFIVLRRDWRSLACLIAFHGIAIALTLAFGSPEYRGMMLWQGTDLSFATWQLEKNILNFVVKETPLIGGTAAAMISAAALQRWSTALAGQTVFLFAAGGVLAAGGLSIPASAKIGAAENYYFVLGFFMTLFVCAAPDFAPATVGVRRIAQYSLLLGWGAAVVATAAAILGIAGVRSVYPLHERHVAQQLCLAGLPGPRYSDNPYLDLPWLAGSGPYFIIPYNYNADRAAGRTFERDGVGGLIGDGYFGTLALGAGKTSVDGALLDRYERRLAGCAGLDIYVRKS